MFVNGQISICFVSRSVSLAKVSGAQNAVSTEILKIICIPSKLRYIHKGNSVQISRLIFSGSNMVYFWTAGISVSNPAEGMDIPPFCLLCVVQIAGSATS